MFTFVSKKINQLTYLCLIFRLHNFQNGSNVLKNMQQKVKRVQKMLNELAMIKTSKDLYLNVTTQNFISTEFYHIGIKNLIADKVPFTDRYTWQNFRLRFLHLVNRLCSNSQDAKIVNESFAMCNGR